MGAGIRDDPTNTGDFTDANKIPYGDAAADLQLYYPDTPWLGDNGLAGAATGGYERSGDYDKSPYYDFFDWYNAESSDTLVMLHNFQTTQQVTEWTCGPASALMVANWFGKKTGPHDRARPGADAAGRHGGRHARQRRARDLQEPERRVRPGLGHLQHARLHRLRSAT